jgi:hypothetical protein
VMNSMEKETSPKFSLNEDFWYIRFTIF